MQNRQWLGRAKWVCGEVAAVCLEVVVVNGTGHAVPCVLGAAASGVSWPEGSLLQLAWQRQRGQLQGSCSAWWFC